MGLIDIFSKREKETDPHVKYTLENAQSFIEKSINNLINNQENRGFNGLDYDKKEIRRKNLIDASRNCGLGDIASKVYMKSFIMDILTKSYGVNKENIDYMFDFENPSIAQDKFEIIFYKYKKIYAFKGLKELIKKYKLDEYTIFDGKEQYVITGEHINDIFNKESIELCYEDKLEIITQRIYQDYKGLGSIDEIRDQCIDGISGGTSGIPIDFVGKLHEMQMKSGIDEVSKYKMSYDSIWLYFEGKEIYLEFLGLGSQEELERICKLIYRFNNPKQFTKDDGYIFSTMVDLSRVAVYRPPFAEKWCFFIRKFDIDSELEELITGKNCEYVIGIHDFIAKSLMQLVVTGDQGVGKTTLLIATTKKMYSDITIRVWEDFFEAYLSLRMANQNTLAVRSTSYLSGDKGLAAIKKSNGIVTIITEAAEDIVINYLVKVALGSSRTLFWTYHSSTQRGLIEGIRNGAINAGGFTDEIIAEQQVLKILGFESHLIFLQNGKRVVGRLTEYIELDKDINNVKATGSKLYKDVNIIEYDLENNKYVVKNKISDTRKELILKNLHPKDKIKFLAFVEEMESMIESEV